MLCFVHLYVERPHCFSLSIVGPTAATAAADDAEIFDMSGIEIRFSDKIEDVSNSDFGDEFEGNSCEDYVGTRGFALTVTADDSECNVAASVRLTYDECCGELGCWSRSILEKLVDSS